MCCGVVASQKLECKCTRGCCELNTDSVSCLGCYKFLNITDVFDYLRFNFKTRGNEKPRKT